MSVNVNSQCEHCVAVDAPEELAKFEIAGKTASRLFYPESNDQVIEAMAAATREGRKVILAGNNSQRRFGAVTEQPDWVISLAKMNSVVEHDVADLIVTAQAGVSLPTLQNFLVKSNQRLGLEIAEAETRTLGGIIATTSPNIWHSSYGGCRDLVLGMKVVLPDGSLIRAGGKTVKNVAGYDLSKLFIGAFGTLGAIAEITFKLSPIPASSQSLILSFDRLADAFLFFQKISAMNFLISRYEYMNRTWAATTLSEMMALPQQHGVMLTLIGHPVMVQDSAGRIRDIASLHGALVASEEDALPGRIAETGIASAGENALFSVRISVPKAKQVDAVGFIEEFAGRHQLTAAIQALMFSGIVTVEFSAIDASVAVFRQSFMESIREKISALNGTVIGLFLPREHRNVEMVWGKTDAQFSLMAAIKKKYDPNGVFVAGRFVGGL